VYYLQVVNIAVRNSLSVPLTICHTYFNALSACAAYDSVVFCLRTKRTNWLQKQGSFQWFCPNSFLSIVAQECYFR